MRRPDTLRARVSEGKRTSDLKRKVTALRWYHTLELPGGIVTPGEYDLRPIVERLPWPDLTGARCLDVGGRDGFYGFEMERRGAAEVVSLDIDDPDQIDFPGGPSARPPRSEVQSELDAGNRAFEAAKEVLGSRVERRFLSIYDVSSERLGSFDFAVIGTLLLHLRDPLRGMTAVRDVVRSRLLINEPINVGMGVLRSRPEAQLGMSRGAPFWWFCNPAGLRRLAEAAGFRVLDMGRPYPIPYGAGRGRPRTLRSCFRRPLGEVPARLALRRGAWHVWILCAAESDLGGDRGEG